MRPSGHQVTPRLQVQVRQVTPHLCAFFRAGVSFDSSSSHASRVGVSCDSSPSLAFRAGASDPIAFVRFVNYKCPLPTAAADEGLLSCEL